MISGLSPRMTDDSNMIDGMTKISRVATLRSTIKTRYENYVAIFGFFRQFAACWASKKAKIGSWTKKWNPHG
jgi:hypothetical protein